MENKKQIRSLQLTVAIMSTLSVLSYFLGIYRIRINYMLGEFEGTLFKLFTSADKMAEAFGSNITDMDEETITILVLVFVAGALIPAIISLISAIMGYVSFGKNGAIKGFPVISIVSAIYTLLASIFFIIVNILIKEEMGYATYMVGFNVSIGVYIKIALSIAIFIISIILLSKIKAIQNNDSISETDVGLVGVSGMWTDAEFFNNSGVAVVIGRDASQCHVVISENAEKISRKHCTVDFDYKNNVYMVTDHSTYGTFLENGKKLVTNLPTPVECQAIIILGDEKNAFRLN